MKILSRDEGQVADLRQNCPPGIGDTNTQKVGIVGGTGKDQADLIAVAGGQWFSDQNP